MLQKFDKIIFSIGIGFLRKERGKKLKLNIYKLNNFVFKISKKRKKKKKKAINNSIYKEDTALLQYMSYENERGKNNHIHVFNFKVD